MAGSGCFGGERTRRAGATDDANEELGAKLGVSLPDYDLEDELRVFQWTDYWPPRIVANFERVFGVSVTVDRYSSNEELRATLRDRGTDGYDVVFPSDYMVNILASEGLIRPVNLDRIPNWSNLERRWVRDAPYDPGPDPESHRYSVPYQWGTTGLGWREELVDEPVESWDVMWDRQYAGEITWLNDVRETLGASLKRLGYSLNTRDRDAVDEAKEALIELQERNGVKEFDSAHTEDFLVNKEATPIHTWSGEALIAYWHLFDGDTSPVKYRIPKEGGVVWIDTAAIPTDAPHPNAAHAFVNYLLAARPGGAITNYTRYATPNRAAKEYVDERMLENPNVYPPDEVREKLEFIQYLGPTMEEYYKRAWREVLDA